MSIQQSITQPLSLTALLLTQAPAFKQAQQVGAAKTRVATSNTLLNKAAEKYEAATTSSEKATLGKTMMKAAEEAVAERKDIAYITGKEKDINTYIEGTEKLPKLAETIEEDVSTLADEEARAEAIRQQDEAAAEAYEEERQMENEFNKATRAARESQARKQNEMLESMRKTNPEAVAAYETIYGKGGMR